MIAQQSRSTCIYITNWSLAEPLCQSQSVGYLRALAARGYPSCLMTFERPPYALRPNEAADARRELAAEGICWHPVDYHGRRNLIVASYDLGLGLTAAIAAILRHGASIVHTRSSVPAAIGLLAARLSGPPFL